MPVGTMLGDSARVSRRSLATILAALAGACAPAEEGPPAVTVLDSAGIEIVTSSAPAWSVGEGWRLASEPEVTIGFAEGDERYLLSQVYGVRRFHDGRIAVLDAGSQRVRVYDGTGVHLFDVGGAGDGPSELNRAQFFDIVSDTIVVYEAQRGTLTWFDDSGRFIRSRNLPGPPEGWAFGGTTFGFPRGEVGFAFGYSPVRPPLETGIRNGERALWRYPLRGEGIDSILVFPDAEENYFESDGRLASNFVLFGARSFVAASDDQVFIGWSKSYSIKAYDLEGSLRRIIRRVVDLAAVTPEGVESWGRAVAEQNGMSEQRLAGYLARIREMAAAETMPAFNWLLTDEEGNLWVEEWHDISFGQGPLSVFSEDGAWLGQVNFPPGLPQGRGINYRPEVFDIGRDYVLGTWEDDLGVEQVRLYRLIKGS